MFRSSLKCLCLPSLLVFTTGCSPDSIRPGQIEEAISVEQESNSDMQTPTRAAAGDPPGRRDQSMSQNSSSGRSTDGDHGVADWPALFGPDRTSVSSANLHPIWPPTGPKLIWEVASGTGYGSPVTADGRVVFNSRVGDEEIVQCHDVRDGELIWRYAYPTSAICNFEYSDGPYSTPIIDVENRRVFNVGAEGQFACISFDDGSPLWERHLHQKFEQEADIFPVGASAIYDRNSDRPGGQLIFNLGAFHREAGIVSLDPATGDTLWQATEHGPGYGTPFVATIHGKRFVYVLTDEGLVSLDPDGGTVDWHFEYRRRGDLVRNATSPLVFGDKVLIVSSGLGAVCLQVHPDRTYTQVWRQRRSIDSQYNTLILGPDHVYSFTSSRQGGAEFRCVALRDGELTWRFNSELKRGMGLATRDAMFLLGEHGHLAALKFSPDGPRVLSFTEEPLMGDPCYCSPAVHGTTLILKDESRVAAFDLSRPER